MENRAERKKLNSKVDFIIDADIITANSVDVSETGISFQTDTPIKIKMKLGDKFSGDIATKTAELVWAKKESDGSTSYGLQFVEDDEVEQKFPEGSSYDADIW